MRRIVLLALAAVCLQARTAHAQQAYAAVLLEYLTGNADDAVEKMRALPRDEIVAGLNAFNSTRSRMVLPGAAALHTEAALRSHAQGTLATFQLQVATAIVEFGEPIKMKSNTNLSINPIFANSVTADFRTLWYCSVISVLQDSSRLGLANGYLNRALAMFPNNAEIRLLAGVGQEMRGSPRVTGLSAGDRRDAVRAAERQYRLVLAAAPDRLEARLRLGRVLQQRNELNEARSLLTPLVSASDTRIAYLAQLFLGGIEDASRHPDAALAAYRGAAATLPTAQTARLAASELQHRAGDRHAAAEAVPEAAGDANVFDPWWTYIFGEYWRSETLLDALRKMRHT